MGLFYLPLTGVAVRFARAEKRFVNALAFPNLLTPANCTVDSINIGISNPEMINFT